LQRLQAGGALVLPPLHPTTARSALHSARSAKTSKSEPASTQVSRRTSDSNSLGGAGHGSEPGEGGGGLSARQKSLPTPAALPSSRRHSIACLVEVSRKQQARHCLKGGSEGGLPPAAADSSSSSVQKVQPLQPLQPLKQLQDIRRRGQQMRVGEDTSRDCQVRSGPVLKRFVRSGAGAALYGLHVRQDLQAASLSCGISGW
jgi:hypothetical protein